MTEQQTDFVVVRNDEEQYSIWPAHQELPNGWQQVGSPAERQECLSRIGELWKDILPRSARRCPPDSSDSQECR